MFAINHIFPMKVLSSIVLFILIGMAIYFIVSKNSEKIFRYRLDEKIVLKGKVSLITNVKYDLINKSQDMQLSQFTTLLYDTSNHIVYGAIYFAAILDKLKFYYMNDTGRNRIKSLKSNVAENTNVKFRRLYQQCGNSIEVDEYYIGTKTISKSAIRYHVDYFCGINSDCIGGKILTQLDNNGNLIEWKNIIHDTEVVGTISGKYDSLGNLTEENGYMVYDGGESQRLVYQYRNIDFVGNWLRRLTLKNGKPIEIDERTIEYYPSDSKN